MAWMFGIHRLGCGCEIVTVVDRIVRDIALSGGSYVVVSPLGSVDDVALPVRADRTGMLEDQSTTDSDSNPSTSKRDDTEDA